MFDMHQSLRFLLAVLAVWRLTHLLAQEDGPWDVFRRLRSAVSRVPGGRLLSCFYCLSLWVAIPAGWFVGETLVEQVAAWLAASGAAVLLERVTAPVPELTIEESDDELLRAARRTGDDQPG